MAGIGYRIGKLLGRQSGPTQFVLLVALGGAAYLAYKHWDAVRPFASFLVGLTVLLIVVAAAASSASNRVRGIPTGDRMACTSCGHVGPTKTHTRGQFWVEVFLWLLLLIPGIIYTVWRLSSRTPACAVCGSTQLVPEDSPVGRRIAKDAAPPR